MDIKYKYFYVEEKLQSFCEADKPAKETKPKPKKKRIITQSHDDIKEVSS